MDASAAARRTSLLTTTQGLLRLDKPAPEQKNHREQQLSRTAAETLAGETALFQKTLDEELAALLAIDLGKPENTAEQASPNAGCRVRNEGPAQATDSSPSGFNYDYDSFQALLVSGPLHGQLSLNSDGSFSYTNTSGTNVLDSFTYQAADSLGNLTARRQANLPPVSNDVKYKSKRAGITQDIAYPLVRRRVETDLALLEPLDTTIRQLETDIEAAAQEHYPTELAVLQSTPGVGPIIALTITLEIDTIARFDTRQQFCSSAA